MYKPHVYLVNQKSAIKNLKLLCSADFFLEEFADAGNAAASNTGTGAVA